MRARKTKKSRVKFTSKTMYKIKFLHWKRCIKINFLRR
nr:MAG TPA: hypothetical protein [Caudoviricetes sp.]